MSRIKTNISIYTARCIRFALRLFNKGATTLPGKIALKIQPDLIRLLAENKDIIVITGTNGKTTTTHMTAKTLETAGYTVITNVSGANLATGIATTMIDGISTHKKCIRNKEKIVYVLEMDEAAFSKTNSSLKPKVHVITNLFRDQLDRYGEITYTRDLLDKGLNSSGEGVILLNADDSMVASLKKNREDKIIFFGMHKDAMKTEITTGNSPHNNVTDLNESGNTAKSSEIISDAAYCLFCRNKYEYNARSFGHLGDFFCPKCGFKRTEPEFSFSYSMHQKNPENEKIMTPSDTGFPVELHVKCESQKCESQKVETTIPGIHNFYNLISAVCACSVFGEIKNDKNLSFVSVCKAVQESRPAFGRMEKIKIGNKYICLLLVKNPIGLERALSFVSEASDAGGLYFLLNSNIADGKDVSWIWDVDFESRSYPRHVFVSGERYGDMALRLFYAGISREKMETVPIDSCAELMETALARCEIGECLYILPNYTSMLYLRKILVEKYKLKDFWK